MLKNNLNDDYFTQVDIAENCTFSINAKTVNLITKHPINIYKLIEEDGLITILKYKSLEIFGRLHTMRL